MKPKYLKIDNGNAKIRDFSLVDLAHKYGTPLFVLDQKELIDNINDFKSYFHSNLFKSNIVYASKALLVPELVNICNNNHLFIDAVSLGDLYVLKESHFEMKNVVFHGNNKSIDELKFAIENDVIIVVDNLEELMMLKELNPSKIRTMVRINPGIEAHTHKYIQTALNKSKFGINIEDDEQINQLMKIYLNNSNLVLLGFHSHIGSQIYEKNAFLLNADKMMRFSKKISDLYQYHLSSINLGGGFGIKYVEEDQGLDLKDCLNALRDRIEELTKELDFKLESVYIEPGRRLLGASCITLYTCCNTKTNLGGHKYLFIDGGMTDNIRPALYQAKYHMDIANKMNDEKNQVFDVAGKCCESGDLIGTDIHLPNINPGDILIVYSTGAYTYSMSSNYNNMLKPAVIFLDDDVKITARRQNLEDLMILFKNIQ